MMNLRLMNMLQCVRDPAEAELEELDNSQGGELTFYALMKLRYNRVMKNLEEPIVRRVFLYLILHGFTPSFETFHYFWVLNCLHLSKFFF